MMRLGGQDDFYRHLRERMRQWLASDEGKNNKFAEYLMFGPDLFHLLCKLALDPDVPVKQKAKLAAAIAYFVAPADLLPELLTGPLGFGDDIAVASIVLNGMINSNEKALVEKHWAGDADVLELIQKILAKADKMVGGVLWRRLRKKF